MNSVLKAWNNLDLGAAALEILPCCGSLRWANELAKARAFIKAADLFEKSDAIWLGLNQADWDEAFSSHPRIGEKKAPEAATAKSAEWSSEEQSGVTVSGVETQQRLQRGNEKYEQRFGRTYIVCASGKSAEEMLAILENRLGNDPEQELLEAVEQQRQITQLRLRKWLQL